LVFGVAVTTKDSYFVLDGSPDPPMEKETFLRGGVLDLENFKFRSAFQPHWAISAGARLFS